ncbi:restriction endonuclease subunit S [Prevotella sp. TF12-30]|uniref:restriction endonuclease subunit S n=1 Tax=Prevotellaceae TaxID=171552 RepID=UPI000E43C13E|nr:MULTISPECIES: restriction endonuclease subunit S [Prevotellaceae]RGK36019.1 restriction endonuclease subunit S [Prevotella sp. TF12-30]
MYLTSDKPHYPFELPKGWEWCRLDDIAYVASGSTPEKSSFVPKGIPYIKMYNLRNQKIDFEYKPQYITAEIHNGKLQRSRTEVGDLIMNIVGPPLGKLAIIPPSLPQANFNQAAVLIRPYLHKDNINVYLKAYLEEMSEINSISTKGSAGQVNISLTQSQNMRIPLPPLPEIERIIKNLKYWLSFVDNIEENKEKLQDSIRQVKSKVLDLAIHGKLVPQDPNDEPAIELLKRINPKAEITCDTPQYGKLPKGWGETHIGDAFKVTMGQSPDGSSLNSIDGMEFHQGKILFGNKYLRKSNILTNSPTKIAEADTLLLCVRAPVGVVNITKQRICIGRGLCCLTPTKAINLDYAFYMLTTFQEKFESQSTGSTFKAISGSIIKNEQLWLPPLSEQHRIVAKIEELFAQLDKIEASL